MPVCTLRVECNREKEGPHTTASLCLCCSQVSGCSLCVCHWPGARTGAGTLWVIEAHTSAVCVCLGGGGGGGTAAREHTAAVVIICCCGDGRGNPQQQSNTARGVSSNIPGKKGRQHILTMRGHASRQGAFCLLKPRRPQKYNSKLGCLLMLHYWVVHLIGPQAMWSAGVGG